MPNYICQVQWLGQQALVALPERIDVSNAGQIRDELLAVIDHGAEALIADLTATRFCDHAGADAVARAYQRAAAIRTQLRLVVTSGAVLQMLGMSGVGRLVPVYPSVPAALAVLSPAANPRPQEPQKPRNPQRTPQNPRPIRPEPAVKPAERDPAPRRGKPETDAGVEVALLNRDGVIIWVNQAWQAFAAANGGDRARTGPGMSYLQACVDAGDDPVAADVAAAIRAALAGDLPGPLAIEVPCHSPAAERWYDVLISARLDDFGQCAGAAVTLSLARSRPREPASAVSANLLWKIIDAVSDGVALADGSGMLVLANRRLEEMFGYRPGELTGQPVERLIPAELQASHRGHHAASARGPSARPVGSGAALTGLRQDGSTFAAEVSLSPLLTARGRFALAVVRDMTTDAQPVRRSAELLEAVVTALCRVGLDQPADTIGDHDGSHGAPGR